MRVESISPSRLDTTRLVKRTEPLCTKHDAWIPTLWRLLVGCVGGMSFCVVALGGDYPGFAELRQRQSDLSSRNSRNQNITRTISTDITIIPITSTALINNIVKMSVA